MLLVETEQFHSLRLIPSQQIEDYFSKILEKGKKIKKSDQEILLKFIQGLPAQLAFFVRAGNPTDVHTALTSSKMGKSMSFVRQTKSKATTHQIKSETCTLFSQK